MSYKEPPPNWDTFGTHVDGVPDNSFLEFSDECDEDGLPRWERVQEAAIIAVFRKCGECGCDVLVRWTPDGADPAPASCTQHSMAGQRR